MMRIGGEDVEILTWKPVEALKAAVEAVRGLWPGAVARDARLAPGYKPAMFVFRDAAAEAFWGAFGAPEEPHHPMADGLVDLVTGDVALHVVIGPRTPETNRILAAIREAVMLSRDENRDTLWIADGTNPCRSCGCAEQSVILGRGDRECFVGCRGCSRRSGPKAANAVAAIDLWNAGNPLREPIDPAVLAKINIDALAARVVEALEWADIGLQSGPARPRREVAVEAIEEYLADLAGE